MIRLAVALLLAGLTGPAEAAQGCFVSTSIFHVSGKNERPVSETVKITSPSMDKCQAQTAKTQVYFQHLTSLGHDVREEKLQECHVVC
jgi:hypothetical protein